MIVAVYEDQMQDVIHTPLQGTPRDPKEPKGASHTVVASRTPSEMF